MEKAEAVKAFVGIDAHSEHCSLKAVGRQGESLLEVEEVTHGRRLRAALQSLPRPVWVMVESSSLAPLLKEWLEPVVDEVVVCETRENRWIARSEDKSDPADADRLARLLRMGEFKAVHVPARAGQERREWVRYYQKTVKDVTRLKNRLKAKYREHGVPVKGDGVYTVRGRGEWLPKVKRVSARALLQVMYEALDGAQAVQLKVWGQVFARVRRLPEYRQLKTIPGVGSRLGAILVAVIDDPRRFENKRRLWKYSGLAVRRRWSSDPARARVSGAPSGNRLMKYAALNAAGNALRGANRFSRHYAAMIEQGADKAMAKRTVARQILATALSMLKSGRVYREAEAAEEAEERTGGSLDRGAGRTGPEID
jgi:transposase